MRRVVRLILVAGVLLILGWLICPLSPEQAGADPSDVLEKALGSLSSLSYSSVQEHVVYFPSGEKRFTVNFQKSGDKCEWSTSGEKITGYRQCYSDKRRLLLLKHNYKPRLEGEDRIAGRGAWVLRLGPARRDCAWKQLWVDKKTFAVLASRDWNGRNKITRSMKTKSILYAEKSSLNGGEEPGQRLEKDEVHQNPILAPQGFELVDYKSDKRSRIKEYTYSDGLQALRVKIAATTASESTLKPGVVYDYGHGLVVRMTKGSKAVTVSGDLPQEDILYVAESAL